MSEMPPSGERGSLAVEDVIPAPGGWAKRLRRLPVPGFRDSFTVGIVTVFGPMQLPIEIVPSADGLSIEVADTVLLAATWAELRFRQPRIRIPAESPCFVTYRR